MKSQPTLGFDSMFSPSIWDFPRNRNRFQSQDIQTDMKKKQDKNGQWMLGTLIEHLMFGIVFFQESSVSQKKVKEYFYFLSAIEQHLLAATCEPKFDPYITNNKVLKIQHCRTQIINFGGQKAFTASWWTWRIFERPIFDRRIFDR